MGAKLFYPETTIIQHAGVANLKTGPDHNFYRYNDEMTCYFGLNHVDYNCSAVTGACLLVESSKFWEVHGFDEQFAVCFNDVSLCCSLNRLGYYNVVRNDVKLYHYESLTRCDDRIDDTERLRLSQELERFYLKFPEFKQIDPYLNRNLRKYGLILETLMQYDRLKLEELDGNAEGGEGNIDKVSVTDCIRITGWSHLEDADCDELKRYLVFVDPYGNNYRATVQTMSRRDVAEHFGDEKYIYSGFECVLAKNKLRMDIMPYKIGILAYDRSGNSFVKWCIQRTDVIRNPRSHAFMCSNKSKGIYVPCHRKMDVRWYVDYVQTKGDYYEIRGFAFCTGNSHFKYQQTLVLVDKNRMAYEFEVQNEERVDVAAAFPEQHFLYNTGFKCYILCEALECGEEYELVIRLSNQFVLEDVVDIVTGQKINVDFVRV